MKKTLCLLNWILFFLLISCSGSHKSDIHFYYWKSKVELSQNEKDTFHNLEAKKLFIRFFDLDKVNGLTSPKAITKNLDGNVLKAEFVPVVFITNRTFENSDDGEAIQIAKNLERLVSQLAMEANMDYREIQIDCDWTVRTQKAYFKFLEELAHASGKKISSTLRLHQVKYSSLTGIPPVSKVYLMCYATTDPTKGGQENSILDFNILQDYLETINDYPISFDLALPVYSWGIVTNHLGKVRLINGVSETDMKPEYLKHLGNNQYQVTDDFFLKGIYLNKGFSVKLEVISPELLAQTKNFLRKKINRPYDIVYYHLDTQFLKHYALSDLTN